MSGAGSAAESVFLDAAGLRLHALVEGPRSPQEPLRAPRRQALAPGPRLVVLHGFTGSAESMESVSTPAAEWARVARLELVGHGESEAPGLLAPYAMEACAAQIVAAVAGLGFETPHLFGYSMGGRAALAAAVRSPDSFASLVLVGATAGIADATEREARIVADRALADSIEREGLEPFVDAWMAQPLFASQARLGPDALARARRQRLANRAHGLANSLRGMGAGAQPPLFDALAQLPLPVLLIAGEQDAKFCAIARALAERLSRAQVEIVPRSGHAVHLEAPDAVARRLRGFVEEVERLRASGERR